MESKSISRSITTLYLTSELFQISAAAVLAVCFVLATQQWFDGLLWSGLLLFVLSIVFNWKGGLLEAQAARAHDNELWAGWHVVTSQRLKTLEVVGVEVDIRDALNTRLNQPPVPARVFASELEQTVGTERAQEKLPLVLRYTRTSEPSRQAP